MMMIGENSKPLTQEPEHHKGTAKAILQMNYINSSPGLSWERYLLCNVCMKIACELFDIALKPKEKWALKLAATAVLAMAKVQALPANCADFWLG